MNSDNENCITASRASCKEQARDMALEIVLHEKTDTCVIERWSIISIPIWVKVETFIMVVTCHSVYFMFSCFI